jgi:methylmalonyl-CoA mutase cobalamin-binding subunit
VKTVVAAALGECVHVAGIMKFLRLADEAGWRTIFLGPAVPISELVNAAIREKADLVGVSYRLTPETGEHLLAALAEEADELKDQGIRFAFGGTPPLAARARLMGFFEQVFEGGEAEETVLAYLKGSLNGEEIETDYPQSAIKRLAWKAPFPLIRHHFGQPSLDETETGIAQIADARVLDVISLGIDQDAQENFFHAKKQNPRRRGAGGVPVRTPEDYQRLYLASRRGNYPLLRTYSGTDDFLRLAEMYVKTINIAWCAIPLFWFNQMDGRGPLDLEESIREHQRVMAWYGERHLPVEVNEPHHWGMRDASDITYVVSAYLAAHNARSFGVRDYISQMMFNSPPGVSDAMDLAKMLAILKITSALENGDFHIWRQTRTGLLSYPIDIDAARGHLAAGIYLQMALKPHIVHVVGHTEAHHAATAEDVIEDCKLARRVIENAVRGQPDMTTDPYIQARVTELIQEAQVVLRAIRSLDGSQGNDPLCDAATLAKAVTSGILDAPQLKNNPYGKGEMFTSMDARGACICVDPQTGKQLNELQRLATLGFKGE